MPISDAYLCFIIINIFLFLSKGDPGAEQLIAVIDKIIFHVVTWTRDKISHEVITYKNDNFGKIF